MPRHDILDRYTPYFLGSGRVKGILTAIPNPIAGDHVILLSERLSQDIIAYLDSAEIVGLVVTAESPFSHMANVLRVALADIRRPVGCVVGIGKISDGLHLGTDCEIDVENRVLSAGGETLSSPETMAYRHDDIGLSTRDTESFCYRPYYTYDDELGSIVVAGYQMLASRLLKKACYAFLDRRGLVWVSGLGTTGAIAEWALDNPVQYAAELVCYGRLLKTLDSLADSGRLTSACQCSEELGAMLTRHYCYSPLVGFVVPHMVCRMRQSSDCRQSGVEEVLATAAMMSPLANQTVSLQVALDNGQRLADELTTKTSRLDVISSLLLLVTLYADIRRVVVSRLRHEWPWFGSATRHRAALEHLSEDGVRNRGDLL